MDQKIVGKQEKEIEESIAEVVSRPELPVLPAQPTMHLMAQAAVTVCETAVENQGADK